MTRHSPSEAAVVSEMPVSGLHGNFTLLTAFNDAVGKEVLLELADGSVFSGIFGGASSDMEIGLYCAYEKTQQNEKNLLPLKSDIVHKRQFAFADIVCVTVPTNDEKVIRGFATDRDYHATRRRQDEDELEAWEGDGEDVDLEMEQPKMNRNKNGGWGVNEMFAANNLLGVTSTFDDDLRQYTTAEVEGTDEDRRRADEIARQIENSGTSRVYNALENDDEERDLDKVTDEMDLLGNDSRSKNGWLPAPSNGHHHHKHDSSSSNGTPSSNSRSSNGRPPPLMCDTPPGLNISSRKIINSTPSISSSSQHHSQSPQITSLSLASRPGNNNNRGGGQQIHGTNRRAEGLKGEPIRRSSNSGVTNPSIRGGGMIGSSHGGINRGGGGGQNNYQRRNDNYDNNSDNRYDNWNTKQGGKTYENPKMREQNKMILENKMSSNSPRSNDSINSSNVQKSNTSGRVENLKAWSNDFNPTFRQRPEQKNNNDKMESPQSSPSSSPYHIPPPTKNAWQHGPPSGLATASPSRVEESPKCVPIDPKPVEDKEEKVEVTASTSAQNDNQSNNMSNEKKDDLDESKDSDKSGKKFSFNPDAPAFTPKVGGTPMVGGVTSMGGGGGIQQLIHPSQSQQPIVPLTLLPQHNMQPIHNQMGAMPAMQQSVMYQYPAQYSSIPQMPAYAVVNGGGIMPGGGSVQGVNGGAPPQTPRGVPPNGVVGPQGTPSQSGVGGGPSGQQQQRRMSGSMYMTQPMQYPTPSMQQPQFMPNQPNYYATSYPMQQPQMMPAGYMSMTMNGQGMMGGPSRQYVQAPSHPQGMVMSPYGQYGSGGLVSSGVSNGMGGGPISSHNGGGGGPNGSNGSSGGGSNGHPPSQPPTPGPPQSNMQPQQQHHHQMYGMYASTPSMVYYGGGVNEGGGGSMNEGSGVQGGQGQDIQSHHMGAQGGGGYFGPNGAISNQGQYYQQQQGPPPHMMRSPYQGGPHGMSQQQSQQAQHAPVQPSQSQN